MGWEGDSLPSRVSRQEEGGELPDGCHVVLWLSLRAWVIWVMVQEATLQSCHATGLVAEQPGARGPRGPCDCSEDGKGPWLASQPQESPPCVSVFSFWSS